MYNFSRNTIIDNLDTPPKVNEPHTYYYYYQLYVLVNFFMN